MRKDNLNMFVRKIVRDSLTLDAMTWENVYARDGSKVVEWWAMDAATIEPIVDQAYNTPETMWEIPAYQPQTAHGKQNRDNLAYVQRLQGQVVAEYTEGELAYGIRNPRTDVEFALYGLSELELLIETVTSHLNAEKYNSTYFTHSNLPQGVLSAVGKYDKEQLIQFRKEWQGMVSGVVGKHKVPFFAAEEGSGINFTPFRQNNRDMEFNTWLEYLTTVTCAIYCIDPSEIGFRGFSAGGASAKVDSDAQATKIQNGKDKGFVPLMTFVSDQFNQEILDRIAPDFEFQWVGLNPEDEEAKINLAGLRLEKGITVPAIEQKALDINLVGVVPEGEDISWIYKPLNAEAAKYVQGAQEMQKADQENGHELEQAQQKHGHELEKQAQAHGQAKDLEGYKHINAKELKQDEHGHKLEQAVVGGKVAGENQGAQDERKGQMAQDDHGRQLEMTSVQHEQGKELVDKEAELGEQQAGADHGREVELTAMQHEQALQSGDLDREHDAHQQDQNREVKADTEKAKSKKRKLSKGLTIEILE